MAPGYLMDIESGLGHIAMGNGGFMMIPRAVLMTRHSTGGEFGVCTSALFCTLTTLQTTP